jgi:hypothetical protein
MSRSDAKNAASPSPHAGRLHPLSVGKVVNAAEDAPKFRRAATTGEAASPRWRSILVVDLAHWVQTLKDRRFYRKMELEFGCVDQYFRERGFQWSRGMSLKPSRRVLSKFSALSGSFHPVEKIHVVAPGDPIFLSSPQRPPGGGDASGVWDTRTSFGGSAAAFSSFSEGGALAPAPAAPGFGSEPTELDFIKKPRLIITSMRLLVFQDDHWVSHFYADVVDELPSILSWSEDRGWHRALDNDANQYYRRVRYVSADRKRKSIPCTDTNCAGLVSWLIQLAGERNAAAKNVQPAGYPFPWARAYLGRDARAQHLRTIGGLAEPDTKTLASRAAPLPSPIPA